MLNDEPGMKNEDGAEVALLDRISERDLTALAELYDLRSTVLNTLIHRIVHDEAAAEEILQEIFLLVWREAGSYRTEVSPPLVWLTRIARNHAVQRLRSRSSDAEVDIDTHADSTVEIAQHDNAASGRQREIAEAMMDLPIEQRTLIECAYFRGHTPSELAGRFGLPVGTVKARIRSGMSALRTRLQDSSETPTVMSSLYLEELAALNALGVLEGEDVGDFKRLAANVKPEAQQEIAEYEKVAAMIAAACGQDMRPSDGARERLMNRIRNAQAVEII